MKNFIREALRNDVTDETFVQAEFVKQAQRFHGARSFKFITDYYIEREKKQRFIDEHIFAQGYEKEDFLKVLAKEKGKRYLGLISLIKDLDQILISLLLLSLTNCRRSSRKDMAMMRTIKISAKRKK